MDPALKTIVDNGQGFVPENRVLEASGWTVPVALRTDIPRTDEIVAHLLQASAQAALNSIGGATVASFEYLGVTYGLHSMDGDDGVKYVFIYPQSSAH
jgi:hypothetical protein